MTGSFIPRYCLILSLAIATSSFGGEDHRFFGLMQAALFLLGVYVLLRSTEADWVHLVRPFWVWLGILAICLIQIVPAPLSLFGGGAISIAPVDTGMHLVRLLTYAVMFLLVARFARTEHGRKTFVYGLVAIGLYEATYGLFQYLSGWQMIYGYTKVFNLQEATGTYINRNHFAGFLGMVLPLAIAMGWQRFALIFRRYEISPRLASLVRGDHLQQGILWFLAALIISTALFFSRSRMGIIAAVGVIIFMTVVVTVVSQGEKAGLVAIVGFFGAFLFLILWIGAEAVVLRFENLSQTGDQSVVLRMEIWEDTLERIRVHPILGSGLGTFHIDYTKAQSIALTKRVNHAHNDYLEILSDLGVFGAVMIFGSIIVILVKSVRFVRGVGSDFDRLTALGCAGSIVMILIHSFADFNLYIAANALTFSYILGLAVGTYNSSGRKLTNGQETVSELRT